MSTPTLAVQLYLLGAGVMLPETRLLQKRDVTASRKKDALGGSKTSGVSSENSNRPARRADGDCHRLPESGIVRNDAVPPPIFLVSLLSERW